MNFLDMRTVLCSYVLSAAICLAVITYLWIRNRRLLAALERNSAERKQSEETLKESEEKLSQAFQNSPDIILITTLVDGKIIEVNDSGLRVGGFARAESIGKTTIELNLWDNPDDRNKFTKKLQIKGNVLNFEANFRKKSGELFIGLVSGAIIQLREMKCVLSVIHDITYRKRTEAAIQKQLDELQHWQNVMIDRESRSLDLKREVNELLAQTGQPPRYESAVSEDRRQK